MKIVVHADVSNSNKNVLSITSMDQNTGSRYFEKLDSLPPDGYDWSECIFSPRAKLLFTSWKKI
jgi:hypothetical protein